MAPLVFVQLLKVGKAVQIVFAVVIICTVNIHLFAGDSAVGGCSDAHVSAAFSVPRRMVVVLLVCFESLWFSVFLLDASSLL